MGHAPAPGQATISPWQGAGRYLDHVVTSGDDRATVEATMTSAAGKVTAIGTGTFVAVKPGHPAYFRW